MGRFTGKSSTKNEERRASIAVYAARLDSNISDANVDDRERAVLGDEKARFDKMTEKEQGRWVDFKMGKSDGKESAAGLYAGGKCC